MYLLEMVELTKRLLGEYNNSVTYINTSLRETVVKNKGLQFQALTSKQYNNKLNNINLNSV